MLLEMSKGFQVGPTSNDRKEIKILSVHGKKQFLKSFTTQQDVQGENCDYFLNQ
jgi:hypothetical protein